MNWLESHKAILSEPVLEWLEIHKTTSNMTEQGIGHTEPTRMDQHESSQEELESEEEDRPYKGYTYIDEDLVEDEPRHNEISANPNEEVNIMPEGSKRRRKKQGAYRDGAAKISRA